MDCTVVEPWCIQCVVPEKIHTPPMEGFWFEPLPHPSGNSSSGSYIPLNSLAFKTPLPLRIINHPFVLGVRIFYGTTQ